MGFDRRRGSVGRQIKRRQLRLGGNLLVTRSTPGAALVNGWGGHIESLSVRGNHEDRYIAQIAEDVGDLVIVSVVAPDHPDPAA